MLSSSGAELVHPGLEELKFSLLVESLDTDSVAENLTFLLHAVEVTHDNFSESVLS